MANLNLLDIAKMNGTDALVGLIEESIQAHPELLGPGRTIRGTSYKTMIRTALPTTGFRDANEGVAAVKSTYKNKLVETFIVNARIETDRAVADAYEDGPEAVMAIEASGVMESVMRSLASQFYYGTASTVGSSAAASASKGFPGLIETYNTSIEVDMAGAGSAASSVWAVKWGAGDVQWVYGNNGSMTLTDTTLERVLDGSTNPYTAYVRELLAYVGLQQVNVNSVGRIRDITTATGLSDNDIANLLSAFPTGVKPDVLYMSRRSLRLLRASRTATLSNGGTDRLTGLPFPDESLGIPIRVTDAIRDTEVTV
jgi:hypothetical protein